MIALPPVTNKTTLFWSYRLRVYDVALRKSYKSGSFDKCRSCYIIDKQNIFQLPSSRHCYCYSIRLKTAEVGWLRVTVVKTLVFDRRTFPVPCSTCSWRVTTYVGKPSATRQPTRPTQPFILQRSINWVVSYTRCVPPRSGGAIWWILTD